MKTARSPDEAAEAARLTGELDQLQSLDAAGFANKYAVPFQNELGYDPRSASMLNSIQASPLALDDRELGVLGKNGFVITERRRFPSFVYGYGTIYMADLPVYVSADSILYAVHESYDKMLSELETAALIPALDSLLSGMQNALAAGAASDLPASSRAHADVYLSVARSLLANQLTPPVAGGDSALARQLFEGAVAAAGESVITLFDVPRRVDFSQFVVRGHYTKSEALKTYFRAMIWLGRIDFRLLETQPDHTQIFHRKQLEAAYVLRALMNDAALAEWTKIDSTVQAFVGESDFMVLPELAALLADLGASSPADLAKFSDGQLAQAIVSGGYGTQRISSHIMVNGLDSGTMPLSSSFALFGQRYVLDSHVFSNVVYDRAKGGSVKRMMPNPLDVSFAALHNNQAGQLLGPELERYDYASDLASMRTLADAHPESFWNANLYNAWLGALRTLSADPSAPGLPKVARTEAWGRRMLNAQHASWAELRHDTILYAKQSYTGGTLCEYPDAYVDPYPELYRRLGGLASRGSSLVASLGLPGQLVQRVASYFTNLQSVALTLERMAEHQRTGAPHTEAHMTFINEAVTTETVCGRAVGFTGWYSRLFFEPLDGVEFDPVIADVHTQPTDEGGASVGRVLHVGTGMPRLMVVTADNCSGPRAYVGLASSYFERTTERYERLTDERWSQELMQATPPDVPWMRDIVVR